MNFYKIIKQPFFGKFYSGKFLEENLLGVWFTKRLKSNSGSQIIIKYKYGYNSNKTIILAHPVNKKGKFYFTNELIAILNEELGFNIVMFDFNGFGESSFGSFSFNEDIKAVIRFCKINFAYSELNYFGVSLGAQMGLVAISQEIVCFKKVLFQSIAPSITEYYSYTNKLLLPLLLISKFFIPFYIRNISLERASKSLNNIDSILFVHSKKDTEVPYSMMMKIFSKISVKKKEILTLTESSHLKIKTELEQKIYFDTIRNFFG